MNEVNKNEHPIHFNYNISNLFSSILFFRVLHGVVDPVKAQISPTLSKNLRNHIREELGCVH